MLHVRVQTEDFDVGAELARLGDTSAGGIASFIGLVRAGEPPGRRVVALTLEHYPAMTQKALERIAVEAQSRWPLSGFTIIHRVGRLLVGEQIVLAAAASPHRAAALQAVAFLMDWLKTSAPFWKLEEFADGGRAWVAARAEDTAAQATWRA